MAINVQMNLLGDDGNYQVLWPENGNFVYEQGAYIGDGQSEKSITYQKYNFKAVLFIWLRPKNGSFLGAMPTYPYSYKNDNETNFYPIGGDMSVIDSLFFVLKPVVNFLDTTYSEIMLGDTNWFINSVNENNTGEISSIRIITAPKGVPGSLKLYQLNDRGIKKFNALNVEYEYILAGAL